MKQKTFDIIFNEFLLKVMEQLFMEGEGFSNKKSRTVLRK